MPEPRWTDHFSSDYVFVGGTPDVDLWFKPKDKRDGAFIGVANGPGGCDWAAYPFVDGKLCEYGTEDDNTAAMPELRHLVVQKHKEIETYLKLFAPWTVEKSYA